MKSVKGSRTEKNLLSAFAGESQARNRYTFFASAAKKSGFEQIAALFLETADNEKEHAKRFFTFLEGGEVEITAAYPAGVIGDTSANLESAACGERLEWTKLYKEAADIADQEGFPLIARQFRDISAVEKQHEARYLKLLDNIKSGKVFKKDKEIKWKCRNCGYVHEGKDAPDRCLACFHPQAFFEVMAENY